MTRRTVAETTGSLGDDYQSVEAARGDSGQLLGESGMKAIGDGLSRIADRLPDLGTTATSTISLELLAKIAERLSDVATVAEAEATVAATPVAPGGLERGLKYIANAAVVIALIVVASNHVRDLK
jgi:hypothetical protein